MSQPDLSNAVNNDTKYLPQEYDSVEIQSLADKVGDAIDMHYNEEDFQMENSFQTADHNNISLHSSQHEQFESECSEISEIKNARFLVDKNELPINFENGDFYAKVD